MTEAYLFKWRSSVPGEPVFYTLHSCNYDLSKQIAQVAIDNPTYRLQNTEGYGVRSQVVDYDYFGAIGSNLYNSRGIFRFQRGDISYFEIMQNMKRGANCWIDAPHLRPSLSDGVMPDIPLPIPLHTAAGVLALV